MWSNNIESCLYNWEINNVFLSAIKIFIIIKYFNIKSAFHKNLKNNLKKYFTRKEYIIKMKNTIENKNN